MDNWQFFLQKEGDYAWLPLETPQVEILEGRYQLMAHTSHPGQSVKVAIRHQYELDGIAQENIQESHRAIGVSGKVELIPRLYLGLGSWSIVCTLETQATDLSDQFAERFELTIDVQSQDFDLFEDWNYNEPSENQELVVADQTLNTSDIAVEHAPTAVPALAPLGLISEGLSDRPSSHPLAPATTESEPSISQESEAIVEQVSHGSETASKPVSLDLPSFSGQPPQVFFRTVSPQELPQLVCDRELSTAERPTAPELPTFTHVKSIAFRRDSQRARTLSKMKLIAAAVQQKERPNAIPTGQLKFHEKLNQMAVSNLS